MSPHTYAPTPPPERDPSTVPESPIGVHVSLDTIYAKLLEMDRKLDPLPTKVDDHEVRLRSLERKLWIATGSASAGAAVFSAIGTTIFTQVFLK